jgi:hypothetical protein
VWVLIYPVAAHRPCGHVCARKNKSGTICLTTSHDHNNNINNTMSPPWSATMTMQTNKHKSGGPNNKLASFGPPGYVFKVHFFFLLLTTCFSTLLGFWILITMLLTHQMTHTSLALPLQASARRVATGPFLDDDE